MQVLAEAHGVEMGSKVDLVGRPTTGVPVNRQLRFSELEAYDLHRERVEQKRSRVSLRGSTHIREMKSDGVSVN